MTEATTQSACSVVMLGATSTLGRQMALRFADKGYAVILAGRDTEELEAIAQDLRVRYEVVCHVLKFDAVDFGSHAAFVEKCTEVLGVTPDGAVVCFGSFPDQQRMQSDFEAAKDCLDTNYAGAMSVIERFASAFEMRGGGFLAAVSSVAGDRGRKGNYHYGAAKAALSTFMEGLRVRLFKSKVSVTLLKPGFLDTKMTWGMDLPERLVASPEYAADIAVRAILKRRGTVYVPGRWFVIMMIIRHIPGALFQRMSI